MFSTASRASIFSLVIASCFQIGSVTGQLNSTDGEWLQLGGAINGEALGDNSGSLAMSADGSIVAIGAPFNDGSLGLGSDVGHARMYQFNNISTMPQWKQLGSDIDGEAPGDGFGSALAISADGMTVVIGASGNDGLNQELCTGHVRVMKFNKVSSQWKQVGDDIDGEGVFDYSGFAVTMSADGMTIAIGTLRTAVPEDDAVVRSGLVRVYAFNLSTVRWEQLEPDINSEYVIYDENNCIAMSADGTSIAIGSRRGDFRVNAELNTGIVRVYKFSFLSRQWNEVGDALSGPKSSLYFGSDVSMSADGTTIASISKVFLGEEDLFDLRPFPYNLHVQVFKFSNVTSSWNQVGVDIIEFVNGIIDSGRHSLDMSADGKTVAVGTVKNNHVRVFTNDGTLWEQVGPNITYGQFFETTANYIALSADGSIIGISGRGTEGSGEVRVYKFNPSRKSNCDVSWKLYNSATNKFVASLVNGTIVANPPPCNRTNIEAVVPCLPSKVNTILLELYAVRRNGRLTLVQSRRERRVKFFLFGNNRSDVFNGRIPSGTYMIRAFDNDGVAGPFTRFTLGGTCA